MLEKSLEYYILTEGAFDVTIRPLLKLWGFKGETIYKKPGWYNITRNKWEWYN